MPSVAGATPSPAPSSVIVGTVIGGQRRQPALDASILRIAVGKVEAVAIAVDHAHRRNRDCRGPLQFARSRHRRTASSATIASTITCAISRRLAAESRAAALELEVVLVPQRHLALGPLRRHRVGNILDQIGIDAGRGRCSAPAIAPRRRRPRGRPSRSPRTPRGWMPSASISAIMSAPTAACSPERGVLAVAKPGQPVAAQIGNDDAAASARPVCGDVDIGMNVVGKPCISITAGPSAGPAS